MKSWTIKISDFDRNLLQMSVVEDELQQRISLIREKQVKYYYPDQDDAHEAMDSIYLHIKKGFPWGSHSEIPLICTQSMSEYTYEVSELADILSSCRIETKLPALKVNKSYTGRIRIRWCRKPCIKITASAIMSVDGSLGPRLSKYSLDYHHEVITSKDYSGYMLAKNMMGDNPKLTTFQDYIPETTISMDQPWEFAEGFHKAIPLFKCRDSKIKFTYKFDLDVFSMIQMETYDDKTKTWTTKKPHKSILESWCSTTIPTPNLIGSYAKLIDEEKLFFDKIYSSGQVCKQEIETCYTVVKKNVRERAEPISLKISCPGVCSHIGLITEDEKAHELNEYFKTSTMINNYDSVPIKFILDLGGVTTYPDDEAMDTECYSRTSMKRHGLGNPPIGYSLIPFCRKVRNPNKDLSLVLDDKMGAMLRIEFFNETIIKKPPTQGSNTDDKIEDITEELNFNEEEIPIEVKPENNRIWKIIIILYSKIEIIYEGGKARIKKD